MLFGVGILTSHTLWRWDTVACLILACDSHLDACKVRGLSDYGKNGSNKMSQV